MSIEEHEEGIQNEPNTVDVLFFKDNVEEPVGLENKIYKSNVHHVFVGVNEENNVDDNVIQDIKEP